MYITRFTLPHMLGAKVGRHFARTLFGFISVDMCVHSTLTMLTLLALLSTILKVHTRVCAETCSKTGVYIRAYEAVKVLHAYEKRYKK